MGEDEIWNAKQRAGRETSLDPVSYLPLITGKLLASNSVSGCLCTLYRSNNKNNLPRNPHTPLVSLGAVGVSALEQEQTDKGVL